MIIDVCPMIQVNAWFSFGSGLLCNSEVSGKSSFWTEFRPWRNLVPIYVTSQNTPEILLSCKIRTYISGISCFFWRRFLICLPCGRTPLGTQRWTTASILANFRPEPNGKRHSLSLLWLSTSFDTNRFTRISDGGIVLRSFVSAINRTPVQLPPAFNAYPMKRISRRTDALDLGLLQLQGRINCTAAPKGMIGPSNGEVQPTFTRRLAIC